MCARILSLSIETTNIDTLYRPKKEFWRLVDSNMFRLCGDLKDPEGVNSCIESRVAPCFLSDLTQCRPQRIDWRDVQRSNNRLTSRKKEPRYLQHGNHANYALMMVVWNLKLTFPKCRFPLHHSAGKLRCQTVYSCRVAVLAWLGTSKFWSIGAVYLCLRISESLKFSGFEGGNRWRRVQWPYRAALTKLPLGAKFKWWTAKPEFWTIANDAQHTDFPGCFEEDM